MMGQKASREKIHRSVEEEEKDTVVLPPAPVKGVIKGLKKPSFNYDNNEESSDDDEEEEEEILDDWLNEQDIIVVEDEEDEDDESDDDDEIPKVELTPYLKEHEELYDVMQQVPLFCNLSQNQQEEVLKSLKSAKFKDGESVVKQGDRGNKFYMIVHGEAVVTKTIEDGTKTIMLTHLYAGHYFGELALLYDDARTATVRAIGDVELMYLSRKDFQKVSHVHLSLVMKQVPLLKELNSRDQDAILNKLKYVSFQDGEYIVKQGEEGDRFYIIMHGNAVITEKTAKGVTKELTRIYPGHTFGEMSLIYDEPRSASVQAVGPVKCVFLTKTDFREALKSSTNFHRYIQHTYIENATVRAMRSRTQKTKKHVSSSSLTKKVPVVALETKKLVKNRLANGEKVLNKYVIKGDIGKGQFGRVQLAQDEQSGKLYAIKIMARTLASYLSKKEDNFDLRMETAIMKKLHHPNIVRLIEVIDDPCSQKIYLVQEYVEKGNLMQILKQDHPFSEERIRKYMHCILRGIQYLHFQKVIHRDIKPENLLVTSDDMIKIADFGAADMFKNESETFNDAKGTPAFMAPEIFDENASYVGPPADIWSLGATLYMMVVGQPPWTADNEIELVNKVARDELTFPSDLNIPPHLRNLLERMLTKDPDRRISLPQVIAHEWITKEGSEPVEMVEYTSSDQVTVSLRESEVAISNVPQHIDERLCETLKRANLMMKSEKRSPLSLNGSSNHGSSASTNLSNIMEQDPSPLTDAKNLLSSWRYHKRANLVQGHLGLSDRSKEMLINQKRVALSADRAQVSELIVTDSASELLEWKSASPTRRNSNSDLSSPKKLIKTHTADGSFLSRPLERKKDFVMVTSEVMTGNGGHVQRRKVLFQAKNDDFSIASNLPTVSSKELLRKGSKRKEEYDISGLNDMVNEHVSDDDDDDEEESSSEYSEVEVDVDLNDTFNELIRTPKNLRNAEDEDLRPIATFFDDDDSTECFQASASSVRENLHLGIRVGYADAKGHRPTMEDRSVCIADLKKDLSIGFFAVYDGHNGDAASSMLEKRFHQLILQNMKTNIDEVIYHACNVMDQEIIHADKQKMEESDKQHPSIGSVMSFSGSTAAFVIITKVSTKDSTCVNLHVANVGDCRVVLCRGAEAIDMTQDHKAQMPIEKERIEKAGGFVHNGRLNGVLAVSRAFGDVMHKTDGHLIAKPDVVSEIVSQDDEFIILASDGLFDTVSSQQAVNFIRRKIRKHGDVQLAAQELVAKSLSLLGHDNISVVVVCLNQSNTITSDDD